MIVDFEVFCNVLCEIELNNIQKKIISENDINENMVVIAARQYGGTTTLTMLLSMFNVLQHYNNSTVVLNDGYNINYICSNMFRKLEENYKKYLNVDLEIEVFRNYTITFLISGVKVGHVIVVPGNGNNQLSWVLSGSQRGTALYINCEHWSYDTFRNNRNEYERLISNDQYKIHLFQSGLGSNTSKSVPEYYKPKRYTILNHFSGTDLFLFQDRMLNTIGKESYLSQYLCSREEKYNERRLYQGR